MSPKQHIETLVASVMCIFFVGHRKVVKVYMKKLTLSLPVIKMFHRQLFPPTPYFYGAEPANITNAVKDFVSDIGPYWCVFYHT